MSAAKQIELNYLVFDDDKQAKHQTDKGVKVDGATCNIIFIDPEECYDVNTDRFDIDAFKELITENTKGINVNLIATDWNMMRATQNYPEINGLQIVQIMIELNAKYSNRPFIIYSANSEKASEFLIEKIKQEINEHTNSPINSHKLLSMLLELKIKFCTREERFREISAQLKGEKTISTIVLNLLNNFNKNMLINTGNYSFDGNTIQKLLELIEHGNDLGLKFIREFIELSIANYTELNA